MAEDIPEEAEFLPDMPPPVSEPPKQPRKPDYGLFLALISLFAGVLIPILQMNGVEINWGWSAVAYSGIILGFVWTFLSHAAPHRGKVFKVLGSLAIVAVLLPLAATGIRRQYHKEHSPPPTPPTDTNVVAAVKSVGGSVSDLKSQLATNSDPRLAALASEQKDIMQIGNELQKKHELLNFSGVNLNTLRAERDNELAQQTNQNEKEAIQQQIDAIKNQQKEQQQKEIQQEQKRQADKIRLEKVKSIDQPILSIFDNVICRLDKMLDGIASQAGEKRFSDLSGGTPTIYSSDLVKDGRIIVGTNSISIGTNSAWDFEISTAIEPAHLDFLPGFNPPPDQIIQWAHKPSLIIASRTKDGESILTIKPSLEFRGEMRSRVFNVKNSNTSDPDEFIDNVSITLTVPNGLNYNAAAPYDNYTNEIDAALRRLIESQDQQVPLTMKK